MTFRVPDPVPCPRCHGTGIDGAILCWPCDGSGLVVWDFGGGVCATIVVASVTGSVAPGTPDGAVCGMIEYHDGRDGARCTGGYVPFDLPGVTHPERWRVERDGRELTLSPSLLCTACGNHGWIRDGKWVPA